MSSLERCASAACTFANMDIATDYSTLSGIQSQYCVDKGHSPEGMTLPSTTEATTTSSSPSATGTTTTGMSLNSRTGITSGPTATNTNGENTILLAPNVFRYECFLTPTPILVSPTLHLYTSSWRHQVHKRRQHPDPPPYYPVRISFPSLFSYC